MISRDNKPISRQATNKTATSSPTNKSHCRQQQQKQASTSRETANLTRHASSGNTSGRVTSNCNGSNITTNINKNNNDSTRRRIQKAEKTPGSQVTSASANRESSSLNNKQRGSKELVLTPDEVRDLNEMATEFPNVQEPFHSCDGQLTVEQEIDFDDGVEREQQLEHNEFDEGGDDDNERAVLLVELDQESNTSGSRPLASVAVQTATMASAKNDLSAGNPASQTKRHNEERQEKVESPLGWEQHADKEGLYYWHVSSGVIQRHRPTSELSPRKNSLLYYHDDEEINQAQQTSSDEEDFFESGAVLTTADDTTNETPAFVVYLLGRAEFDETQLASNTSTKAIQKCILRLCNKPAKEEIVCWGLDQSSPVLMRLCEDYIQFTDIKTRALLRSQPIQTIKTWAVDDNNNFAFVIEECASQALANANESATSFLVDSVDNALLSEPVLMCYVFQSMDEDNMSCKVAAKLNEEIGRYKEQLSNRISRSTRVQQMVEPRRRPSDEITDVDEDFEDLESSNELTMKVNYIGQTPVPRPTGIDVLNAAIDKCLAEASKAHAQAQAHLCLNQEDILELAGVSSSAKAPQTAATASQASSSPGLIEAKLHVSPSSVIVENVLTGEIIVECRIRYLTFIGISRRDIRWCGFIMQNGTSSKSFVAHSFECNPTAGHACEAMQRSCNKMYEKVIKNNSTKQPETISIIPTSSKIRNTLAKTFSRIKLNPIS